MYGIPNLKSPTDKITFRPIFSSIGTYDYKLAKFLTDLLDPIILTDYCARTPFHFASKYQR